MSSTPSPFKHKSRAARIQAYVDAALEIDIYRRNEATDGKTPERTRAILESTARRVEALREMTGGDLATAHHLLTLARKAAQEATP